MCVCVCLFGSSVVAENDFLHTLLNKVTASRGDSGGQGTVLNVQASLSVSYRDCSAKVSVPVRTKGSHSTV